MSGIIHLHNHLRWFFFCWQIEKILLEHELVVITRAGHDIDCIIYENDLLYKHRVNKKKTMKILREYYLWMKCRFLYFRNTSRSSESSSKIRSVRQKYVKLVRGALVLNTWSAKRLNCIYRRINCTRRRGELQILFYILVKCRIRAFLPKPLSDERNNAKWFSSLDNQSHGRFHFAVSTSVYKLTWAEYDWVLM